MARPPQWFDVANGQQCSALGTESAEDDCTTESFLIGGIRGTFASNNALPLQKVVRAIDISKGIAPTKMDYFRFDSTVVIIASMYEHVLQPTVVDIL